MSFLSSTGATGPQSARELASSAFSWLDEATDGATKFRKPLSILVVRPVTQEDLDGGFLVPAPPPTLREIKASHHQLAKLLAAGRSQIEASRITGYSTGYISRLVGDASFAELLTHYSEVEEFAAQDVLGAMRSVGMDMLDELRKRVEEDPRAISTGQLQEGIKLLLIEPLKAEANRAGGGGQVAPITISFVASPVPQAGEVREGKIIEGELSNGR